MEIILIKRAATINTLNMQSQLSHAQFPLHPKSACVHVFFRRRKDRYRHRGQEFKTLWRILVIMNVQREKIKMAQNNLLVRVQDDLYGLHAVTTSAGESNLILPYMRKEFHRNTLHFCVNGIVADHTGGNFNQNPDGSLSGKIVILADPREMKQPAGLGQVDAWYQLDATVDAQTGRIDRSLNLGSNALVIAPQGTELPHGVQGVFYDEAGGIQARNAAVKKSLEDAGVPMEKFDRWGWMGQSIEQTQQWERSPAVWQDFNVTEPDKVNFGAHTGSLDDQVEDAGVPPHLLADYRINRLTTGLYGEDIDYGEKLSKRADDAIVTINNFLDHGCTELDRLSVAPFYAQRLKQLNQIKDEIKAISKEWVDKTDVPYAREAIAKTPGHGDFFIAKVGAVTPEKVDGETLALALAQGTLSEKDQIWRAGWSAQWKPIGKTALAHALTVAETPAAPVATPVRVEMEPLPSLVSRENTKPLHAAKLSP